VNRTLAVFEPWEIAAVAVCVTLLVVWIFEFLFKHDESKCCLYDVGRILRMGVRKLHKKKSDT